MNFVLQAEDLVGPVNPVSPIPVRNAEFVTTASRVQGRKPGFPVPAIVLRLMMGDLADAFILASRRIEPRKLLASGYKFCYPDLEDALRHELKSSSPVTV